MILAEEQIKIKVQRNIFFLSVAILVGKFIAFFITNSVGIFTDAMESIVNVTAGLISLLSLRWGAKPRDREHPFGHGKIESVSASLEGLMIIIAGIIIIYEGVHRLFVPSTIEKLDIGIIVVAVAGAMNYVMGWYSIRVGKKYNSIALIAGGKHLQSDTYSTIGLVAGLLVLYFTRIAWIDSALALTFGSIILYTGVHILRTTLANLLDRADMKLMKEMVEVVEKDRKEEWIDIHNTKILKYGNSLFIDCDLTLPWYYTIREGHVSCDELKEVLNAHFNNRVQVSIHSDPCKTAQCGYCLLRDCPHRASAFMGREQITVEKVIQSDEERFEH
ncbi:MAG: cation diffusion facilitator family transporter [Marinifilaceae bacterium]